MKTIAYNEMLYRAAEAAGRTRDNLPLAEAVLLKSVFALELARVWASEDWNEVRQPLLPVALDANQSFANPYVTNNTSTVIVTGAGTGGINGTYLLGADPAYPNDYFQAAHNCYLTTSGGTWYLRTNYNDGALQYQAANPTGPWTSAGPDNAPNPTSAYPTSSLMIGDIFGIYDQLPTGSTPWKRINFSRTGDSITCTPGLNQPWWGTSPVPSTVYVYYQLPAPDLLALNYPADFQTLTLPLIFGNYLALRGAGHLLAADGDAAGAGVQFGLAESHLSFERSRIQRPEWTKQA